MRTRSGRLAATTMLAAALMATTAQAADDDGNYAVRGAGTADCDAYRAAAAGETDGIGQFLRWFEGYITGMNRHAEDTFDQSPVLDISVLGRSVLNLCSNEPELSFEVAVGRTLNALGPIRERTASETRTLSHDGESVVVRDATVLRLQERLNDLGLYDGGLDGLYGPGTRRSILQYQESEDLPTSGLPDAATLLRLLLSE